MKESFTIRHKILEALFNSAAQERNPQIPKIRLSAGDISTQTNVPIDKINIYHELLHEEEEINCTFCEPHDSHEMLITSKGRQSYIDSKYLKEGKKQFWDSIYDPLKIILPIFSVGIAALALYQNSSSSNKIEKVETQLIQFKTQLDSINNAGNPKQIDNVLADPNSENNEFKINLSNDTLDKKLISLLKGSWKVESKNKLFFLNTTLNYSDTVKFDDTTSVCMTGWGKIYYNYSVKFYFSKYGSNMYEYYVNKAQKLVFTQIEYRNNDLTFKKVPETNADIFSLNILSKDKIELKRNGEKIEMVRINN